MPAVKPSIIEKYLICPRSVYLDKTTRNNDLPISAYAAKGIWLAMKFSGLIPAERHFGLDLVNLEDMNPGELPKYLNNRSADAFSNSAAWGWKNRVIDRQEGFNGRKIVWNWRNEWWAIHSQIKKNCRNYYNFLQEDGLPLFGYNNMPVSVIFNGQEYVTVFGAIHKGMVVSKYDTNNISKKSLNSDPAITLQLLAYCTMANDEEAYMDMWNLTRYQVAAWGGNKFYIDPDVTFRYYNISNGKKMETHRKDSDLLEMANFYASVSHKIENEKYPAKPAKSRCQICRHNVYDETTGKKVCNAYGESFGVDLPIPRTIEEWSRIEGSEPRQKSFRFRPFRA